MFKNLSTEALGISGRDSELIEWALSFGFKGLDLNLVEFAAQAQEQGLPKARRLIDSARLKIGSVRLPVRWEDDPAEYKADMDNLPNLAGLAQQMGCTRAITTIEPAGDARPYHENFEFHRRKFSDMAAALEPFGIRLGLEFLAPARHKKDRAFQFIQSVDAVLMLLRMISAPNVGLAFDSWHWLVGGGTLEQLKGLPVDKIISVSLADAEPGLNSAEADETSRRLPGETGVPDSTALLDWLAEQRYDGPITPKPHPSRVAGQGRDKIVKAAGAAIDQVWKAAGLNPAGKLSTVGR